MTDQVSYGRLMEKWRKNELLGELEEFLQDLKKRTIEIGFNKEHQLPIVLHCLFNEKRKTKKRKPDTRFHDVVQPWTDDRFHFGKIRPEEIVDASVSEEFMVVVNLFPITHGSMILATRKQIGQNFVGEDAFKYLCEVVRFYIDQEMLHHWILLFSSFGAFASVNSLHTQIVPHPCPKTGLLYLEAVCEKEVRHFDWGRVSQSCETSDIFMRVIVFDLTNMDLLESYCKALHHVLEYLALHDIPHNFVTLNTHKDPDVLIRIAIVPRNVKTFATEGAVCEPAGLEMLGMLVIFKVDRFEQWSRDDFEALKARVDFNATSFQAIVNDCLNGIK